MAIEGVKDQGRRYRSNDVGQCHLGDLRLETAISFLMGVLETELRNENTAAGVLRMERL